MINTFFIFFFFYVLLYLFLLVATALFLFLTFHLFEQLKGNEVKWKDWRTIEKQLSIN
jgi:hypothetical protein